MNSASVTVSPTPGNLLDEFEEAYQNCLAPLIREDPLTYLDLNELRTNAEANMSQFLELGRAMQAFFLQKRFQLATQKPELVMKEEVVELREELSRKDELLKKHAERLAEWQAALSALSANKPSPVTATSMATVPGPSYSGPPMNSGMQSSMGTPSMGNPVHTLNRAMMGQQHLMNTNTLNPGQQGSVGGMETNNPAMRGAGSTMAPPYGATSSHIGMGNMSTGTLMPGQQSGVPGYGALPAYAAGGASPGMAGAGYGASPNMASGYAGGTVMAARAVGRGEPPAYPGNMGGGGGGPVQGGGLQGPLAFLEKTTTNIGMP